MSAVYYQNRKVQITVCGLSDKARRDPKFLKALKGLFDASIVAMKKLEQAGRPSVRQ